LHHPCPTSRDFVPWRFSAAANPGQAVIPAAENQHSSRHSSEVHASGGTAGFFVCGVGFTFA